MEEQIYTGVTYFDGKHRAFKFVDMRNRTSQARLYVMDNMVNGVVFPVSPMGTINMNLATITYLIDSFLAHTASHEVKDDVVDVYRFLRIPLIRENNVRDYHTSIGATMMFRLNYTKKTVDIGVSICNGDRFDRAKGKVDALNALEKGTMCITGLPYSREEIDHCGGLVDWFFASYPLYKENCRTNMRPKQMAQLLIMFDSNQCNSPTSIYNALANQKVMPKFKAKFK